MIAGDGCITRAGRTYKLDIACDAAHPQLIITYQELVGDVMGRKVATYKVKDEQCYRVITWGHDIPVILGLPVGAKSSSGFTIPEWIFGDVKYVKALARGLIETDGAVAKVYRHGGWYWYIQFTASNKNIMAGFMRAVDVLGYPFSLTRNVAMMNNTALTQQMIADLGIAKLKEYRYP